MNAFERRLSCLSEMWPEKAVNISTMKQKKRKKNNRIEFIKQQAFIMLMRTLVQARMQSVSKEGEENIDIHMHAGKKKKTSHKSHYHRLIDNNDDGGN